MRKGSVKPPTGEGFLQLVDVPLSQLVLWDANPKLHDISGIKQALRDSGYQNPVKLDKSLNGGQGGVAYGEGRITALREMKDGNELPPRGVSLATDGEWVIPVYIGVDLGSEEKAAAFAIDHNNLTMAGGSYTPVFMTQMWNEEAYVELLRDVVPKVGTITVDPIDLEVFEEFVIGDVPTFKKKDRGMPVRVGKYKTKIPREIANRYLAELEQEFDGDRVAIIGELKRRLLTSVEVGG